MKVRQTNIDCLLLMNLRKVLFKVFG